MSAAAVLRRVCLRAYRLARRRIRRYELLNSEKHPVPSPIAILRDELSLCAAEALARATPREGNREEIAALSALISAVAIEKLLGDGRTFR